MTKAKVAIERTLEFLSQLKEKDLIYLDKQDHVQKLTLLLQETLKSLGDSLESNEKEWQGVSNEVKELAHNKRERVLLRLVEDVLRARNT